MVPAFRAGAARIAHNLQDCDPVADPKLGTKRQCPNCAARFYDLNKRPNECPKCEHVFEPEVILKPRKPRVTDKPKEPVRAAPAAAEAEEEEAEEDEDEEEESDDEESEDAEDEAEEIEAGEEVETELSGDADSDEETDDDTDANGPKAGGKGRRGTTEEVDPDLEEFDEDEIEGDDDEEDDDTLLEDDSDGDDDLSDIVDDEPNKDDN